MARSIMARAISRVANWLPAHDILPPYAYVQNVVERHLAAYIGHASAAQVKRIEIVGGYLGLEIPGMLRRHPNATIRVFEASRRYQDALERKFAAEPRVSIVRAAASDMVGTTIFYETNLRGSGSLLEVGSLAASSYGARKAEEFEVKTVTLDSVAEEAETDCLWIDVQGAELTVLKGASQTLARTRSIFVEVAVLPDLYKGGVVLYELEEFLRCKGFQLTLLGLDNGNMTGNALFVRRDLIRASNKS